MAGIPAHRARAQFARILARVTRDKIRVVITKRGKEVAAILPIEDLEALEDHEDVEDAKKALAEPGESIPWEKVKRDLGLR